ncbi:pheromone A receptor-domain-containing protein [Amylostereum chailletii]|nr:pheromone A receptor-domain-containing protein [Amylostereum chailletii]
MYLVYPLIPVASFVSLVLIIVTLLTSTRQSWNTGVVMYGAWQAMALFLQGIGSTVWAHDAKVRAPVWCDISTHIDVGSIVAIPACSLVITHRLYKVIRRNSLGPPSKEERRKALFFDLSLTLGLPLICMALYYVVQDKRFQVIQGRGCVDAIRVSGMTVLLIIGWPLLFSTISAVFYCPKILLLFYRQQRDIRTYTTTPTRSRYLRILFIGLLDIVLTLPLGILRVALDIIQAGPNFVFYPGFAAVHADWAPVPIPQSNTFWFKFDMLYDAWTNVLVGLVLFVLFGTTGEARGVYKRVGWRVVEWMGCGRRGRQGKENMPDMSFESGEVETRAEVEESGVHPSFVVSIPPEGMLDDHNKPPRSSDASGTSGEGERRDHTLV